MNEFSRLCLLAAAKLVREICKDPACENRCYHEHAIRDLLAGCMK